MQKKVIHPSTRNIVVPITAGDQLQFLGQYHTFKQITAHRVVFDTGLSLRADVQSLIDNKACAIFKDEILIPCAIAELRESRNK